MVKRPDVNYPKFKDQFAVMDFEAETMPVLSLYPMPAPLELCDWEMRLTDTTGNTTVIRWEDLQRLPKVQEPTPLVCQIFNWSETPEVTGVRLNTVLEAAGLNASSAGYLAFYSADGMYFESLPKTLANDPRMLLVCEICGGPLPHELGGPVRLWAPFLQGYKSVKWLRDVRSFVRDPNGHQAPAWPEQDSGAWRARAAEGECCGGQSGQRPSNTPYQRVTDSIHLYPQMKLQYLRPESVP